MSAITTLFAGPYALLARVVVLAVVALSFVAFGWVKGNEHGTKKLTEYQAKQAVAAVKIVTKQGAVTERVVTKYIKVKGEAQIVTNTIEKEVTKYVESKPLALACLLDNRWIRLHDSAAAGVVPDAARATDGTSGDVSAAEALPTITGNYAKAKRNEAKLNGLQEWVREQQKINPRGK